jgi:spore germination protein YaaH
VVKLGRGFRAALVSVLVIAPFLGSALLQSARADNPPRKILSGWIPYYSIKTSLPAALANPDLISEVTPFWYTLKDAKTIQDNYTPANPNLPIAGTIAQLQAAGYLVLPTITDGTSTDPKTGKSIQLSLSSLLADSAMEKSIVSTILTLVTTNKYDGIDLDWESFAYIDPISTWSSTQGRWVAFIQDLATALHAQGKLLSVTTPPLFDPASGKKGYYLYAWSQIGNAIDRLRIMAYDYSTSTPGPIGPITWTEDAVKYAVSVMPASKVYVGIPGYGRDWVTKVVGTCPSLPINYLKSVSTSASAATVVMHDAANLALTYGAAPTYIAKYGETNFTYQKVYNGTTADGTLTTCTATRTVWYQDAQGFALRAALVAKYHLGGISEWTMGMEDPSAITAIRAVAVSIAPDPVVANLQANVNTAMVGDILTIKSSVMKKDTTAFSGIPVQIETKTATSDWATLSAPSLPKVSAADGTLSISLMVGENTQLRLRSTGSWDRLEGLSAPVTINVARAISWNPPTSMRAGVSYTITGQLQPYEAGITVQLDDGVTGHLQNLPSAKTTADGSFTLTFSAPTSGVHSYRIVLPADSKFTASSTDFVKVLVR